MPSLKQSSAAKAPKKSSQFRIGKVQGYLRGSVWYLYYHEQGQRRRPRVGPDLEVARQMAAQINSQLETGAPAALSFEAISIVDLRNRWLAHHEHVLRSSIQAIGSLGIARCRHHPVVITTQLQSPTNALAFHNCRRKNQADISLPYSYPSI